MAIQMYPTVNGAGNNTTQLQYEAMMSQLATDGVFPLVGNALAVTAGAGMASSIDTGAAWMHGHYFNNDAAVGVTHGAADPTNDRIDLIVCHADLANDTANAISILAGTPAPSPTVPALTQSGTAWEIPLAQVRVHATNTASSQFTYTDERVDAQAVIQPGGISAAMLASGAVTSAKLASSLALPGTPTAGGNTIAQLKSAGGGAAGVVVWVGTTDPAGAAGEGDVWVDG